MTDIFGVTIRLWDVVSIAKGNQQRIALVIGFDDLTNPIIRLYDKEYKSLGDATSLRHSKDNAIVLDFRSVPVDALLVRYAESHNGN